VINLEDFMNLVIFGANGPTGRLLTALALAAGHRVTAVTRRPRDFPLAGRGLTVAEADVRDASAVAVVVVDADAVVSVLGVSFTREPVDTYSVGTANIVAAMSRSGVRRLVIVSSTAAYPTRRSLAPVALRLVEPILTRTIGKTVYDDMRRMETAVRGSELDWTIVRPSGLFDLPEPTNYVSGEVDPVGAFTARVDLADYLLALAADPTAAGRTVIVSTTENTPSLWQMMRREAGSHDAERGLLVMTEQIPDANTLKAFNAGIINQFRANAGQVDGEHQGANLLLLTTTGAKSGQPRLVPLAYQRIDDKMLIVGAYGGAEIDPAWVHNLRAEPRAHIEVGTESFDVIARELPPGERDEMFPKIIAAAPGVADYQAKTSRVIPLFELHTA
jgi:deazaflavin-dependent oxidoreductase (nitroreductase family)